MTEQKKDLAIAKTDQELAGAIEGQEAEKSGFLAKLSDDILDKVSGGMVDPSFCQMHANISVP